ncbi:MAG: hypothetical protein GXO21_01460 [Aquificae bacterium]|nr:hypothetical protein [Aquificota bacterium]
MIKFVKFFGITFFFILVLTVGSMYLSVLRGEGVIRPEAVVFYTIVFFGYGLTLMYVWRKEKEIEIEQARKELELAKQEAAKHKEELEKLKKEFEEYKKWIEQQSS